MIDGKPGKRMFWDNHLRVQDVRDFAARREALRGNFQEGYLASAGDETRRSIGRRPSERAYPRGCPRGEFLTIQKRAVNLS